MLLAEVRLDSDGTVPDRVDQEVTTGSRFITVSAPAPEPSTSGRRAI